MSRSNLAWALGFCAIVVVTTRYTDPQADRLMIEEAAGDSYSYLAIAEAAPGVPHEKVQFHHAQRFAIPYAIGVVHSVVPVSVHHLFLGAVLVIEIAILVVFAGMLDRFAISRDTALLALAMLVFNPWAFRHYLTYPEMVNDLGFVLGLAILVRGLVTGGIGSVVMGQLIASLSRQTGLLLFPLVLVWVWRDAGDWRQRSARSRVAVCAAVGCIAAAVYVATGVIASAFAEPSQNAQHILGLAAWLAHEFDPAVLGSMLLRMFAVIAIPVACFAGLSRRARTDAADSSAVPLLLFACACAWIQPLLAGPAVTGGNGERLVGLGLLPLVLALAIAVRDRNVALFAPRSPLLVVAIGLLALGSLHHVYTSPGLAPVSTRRAFGVLYAAVCVGMFALVWFSRSGDPRAVKESHGAA